MTDRIDELTKKIYNEGVVKAKEEADQIIANAKKEAEAIGKAAKQKEAQIVEDAKRAAEEIRKNTDSEIKLAARQFMSKLKQQITHAIVKAQTEPAVDEAFNDAEFIKKSILTLIENWDPQNAAELDLLVLLPEKNKKELFSFFDSKASEVLNKGINVDFDSSIESGFKIGPKDGSYIISFSDTDFENYFKNSLKERTRNLLFETDSM